MGEAADNPGFWSGLLGGVVGFFTGGVGGAIAGAITGWAGEPAPPAPVTGITGMGTAQPGLPTMTGSGLGTLSAGAMPGVAQGQLYGAPPEARAAPAAGTFAARLAALTGGVSARPLAAGVPAAGTFAARLAALRGVAPAAPVVSPMPLYTPPVAVPWWQQVAGAIGGLIQRRQAAAPPAAAVAGVESLSDMPAYPTSSSGVVSIF